MNSATAQPRQLYREPCCYGISVPRSKATFTTCSASFSVQNSNRPLDRNRKHEGPYGPAHRQRGCTAGTASTRRQTVAPCRAVETQRGGISGFAEEAYRCAKTPFGVLLVILSRMNILDRKPGSTYGQTLHFTDWTSRHLAFQSMQSTNKKLGFHTFTASRREEYAINCAANTCRLELSPEEATQSLRFTEVRDGKDIRVVISAVAEGSAAQQACHHNMQRKSVMQDNEMSSGLLQLRHAVTTV